jgi:hypothetical protein
VHYFEWIVVHYLFINSLLFLDGSQGTWRVSAGKMSIASFINDHDRETTYNWLWTMFFAVTCAASICAAYANREYVSLYYQGKPLDLSQQTWILIMSVLWSFATICAVSIALNHYLKKSCEFRVCGGRVVLFGWRQTEGLIALGLTGEFQIIVYSIVSFVPSLSKSFVLSSSLLEF